ncbi:PREDICTED: uncharacterized protein LOC108783296 [Cyphomyrmex costatus]|uniref:Uncharacterized protein n=1 Tax=Cyphomyrmex costatus TaxID=456900 RepID=A0A151IMK5_9HYME|nr:PREDICTED: uncharacterized protein LOC108783296 [Cyphomyrmex costatus]KYN06110.1 hypothetical protein ALC62_02952 [Cyphomyrmex costatus]
MSQSGLGGLNDAQGQNQAGQIIDSQQIPCQNGRAEPLADIIKQDLSNGFENRTMDYERFTQERTRHTSLTGQVQDQQPQLISQQQQQQHPIAQYPSGRRQSVGLPEDKHPSTGQLPPLQYDQDKDNVDRTQHVSQTSTQTVPVQVQPQFAPDYDQSQYPQIRGQFEVRSQIYPQTQYSDRVGFVTRDVTYRDPNLYGQSGTINPMFTGQGQYVTVQHGSQTPSQSTSPQPPYYSGVVVPQPPSGYAQFSTQPQYSYSQYPQTVMNAVPYNPHSGIYPAQQYSGQQSPNLQRFSQEIGHYHTQPIIQPKSVSQNVTHGIAIQTTERSCRGPKPVVPPRGNSKITTHDVGHRKSASVDVPALQKVKYESNPTAQQDSIHRSDGAIIVTGVSTGSEGSDRRYLTTINQNPRTRQDGLYVATNGDQPGREKLIDTIATECDLYVSRSEHRKSVSVDVTTSFQGRNDTITFTFPSDGNQEIMSGRKTTTVVDAKRIDTNQMFPAEQRRLDASLRVSPMAFDTRQENRKSVETDRKSEWGNVSPNQRNVIPPENRRSDYFEEHRRSPMNLEGKRMEDIRRSPMPFVPIRETSIDRTGQKSPSFVSQNFEKTRQELAIWAEQRQRQEHEKNMIPGPIFTTSPRSRNPSEERRDIRSIHLSDDRKESRISQSAFQPLPNINQNTIMEQRRHLRHVSADLTKHMELSRKDFDEQPVTGSVVNLGSVVSTASSQRASPNLCHQYPALSEAKLDTKTVLTVVTDFGESTTSKPIDQIDHIIHSHRKNHNTSSNLLTHSKSQMESLQNTLENQSEKTDSLHVKQKQQQQQLQNQQSLDLISEKLSQFERQQSDLQAKLQCLQNQNQILDKVAQFQHQQSDLQVRFQSLQNQSQLNDKTHKIPNDFAQLPLINDTDQVPINSLSNNQEQSSDKSCSTHQPIHGLHQTLLTTYSQNTTLQACQSSVFEKLTSRVQHDISDSNSIQIPNMSQMPLPCLPQFDRADVPRTSFSQFHQLQCQIESHESASTTNASLPASSFTGTLKKIPPEKPPRTSLIVQTPEVEVTLKK